MSNRSPKVVFVLNLDRANLSELGPNSQIAVTTYTHAQHAEVFSALRAFGVLEANYRVGEKQALDALHRHWHIPPAPLPNWPVLQTGPDPIVLPLSVLEQDGDAIMFISAEKVEFHARVAVPEGAAT